MANKDIKALAVIPARGGSKRLPRKNLYHLVGKPLASYSLEAAIKSQCFSEIILSSDSDEILALADEYSEVTAEKRPAELAGDHVKVRELIRSIVDRPSFAERFDVITLLLPTCPFRQGKDISAGFAKLKPEIDSVVSLTQYEFPPQLSVTLNKNSVISPVYSPSPLITGETRSQDQVPIYRPNGGFYISWWKSYAKNRNYFVGNVKGHVMSREASIDIDTGSDMKLAEFMLENGIFQIE